MCVETVVGPLHHSSEMYLQQQHNGVAVVQWAESNSLTLIHDAKLQKSFNSARWKKGYNPDLIFASFSIYNMCVNFVLNPNPRIQHRPICVTVNHVLVSRPTAEQFLIELDISAIEEYVIIIIITAFRRRFNLRKANWSGYATDVDVLIDEVDPSP